jgi:thioredoxin 1
MKKYIAIAVFGLSLTSFGFSGDEYGRAEGEVTKIYGDLENGIKFFEGTWKEALKEADKSDKLIFLDAYAAWCGPCKMMAKKTFTDKGVGEFFNKEFINFKMDMEKHEDGPRLSKKFNLQAYPTIYFLDENEEIVHYVIGYQSTNDLVSNGRRALNKLTTRE